MKPMYYSVIAIEKKVNVKMNLAKSFFSGGRDGALINFVILSLTLTAMLILLLIFSLIVMGAFLIVGLIGNNEPIKEHFYLLLKQPLFWFKLLMVFQVIFGVFCHLFTEIVLDGWTKETNLDKSFGVGSICICMLYFVQTARIYLISLTNEPTMGLMPQFCTDVFVTMELMAQFCSNYLMNLMANN